MSTGQQAVEPLLFDTERAIRATQQYLRSIQQADGHWCGELEGDTILESEYMLTMHFIGKTDDPRMAKAAKYIREAQLESGGWSIFPGGPPNVSASAKAYFVLKLVGDDPNSERMRSAREEILRLGGLDACNSFTKLYLAIFGQYPWDKCVAVPPEIILLPRWFYINIYEMSSWSRAILIPLSIIWSLKPSCPVPAHADISDLINPEYRPPERALWDTLFHGIDGGLKLLEKLGLPKVPSRARALKRAEKWILERLEGSDGLGAIFPPIINTIIALRAMGYDIEDPIIQSQIGELKKLEIEEEDSLRVQPCFSPVWDTALSLNAMVESGVPVEDEAIQRASRWLLDKRGHDNGDWRMKNKNDVARPGWFFEYANPFYPDNDTTAMAVTALSKVRLNESQLEAERRDSIQEAHHWHLSMQNSDGGWGAFDKDCDKEVLCRVPFADHNAMIDPSNEDITARILETFGLLGYDKDFPPAQRAIRYILSQQEEDGSWFGRWGCNYLYGTWLALWGLNEIGLDTRAAWARRGAEWFRSCQNEDGGWGELPLSYDDATHKGRGPSTPSQTAWAIMGLLAAGDHDSPSVEAGIGYLLNEQQEDGSWEEHYWTGTGFPGVFYLRYHLYGIYFPLMALGHYRALKFGAQDEISQTA